MATHVSSAQQVETIDTKEPRVGRERPPARVRMLEQKAGPQVADFPRPPVQVARVIDEPVRVVRLEVRRTYKENDVIRLLLCRLKEEEEVASPRSKSAGESGPARVRNKPRPSGQAG